MLQAQHVHEETDQLNFLLEFRVCMGFSIWGMFRLIITRLRDGGADDAALIGKAMLEF